MLSKKYDLNKRDIQGLLRNAILVFTPTILIALKQIESGQFDGAVVLGSAVTITIDMIRRFVTDYTTKK